MISHLIAMQIRRALSQWGDETVSMEDVDRHRVRQPRRRLPVLEEVPEE